MEKRKNWSVIVLMAVGILLVTIAGSIFISNTWKLMTETAKEICLSSVTVGIFVGSHFLRKKKDLGITGKALYYLGVVASGFTSYMISDLFINTFDNNDAVRLSFSFAVMLLETAYILVRDRRLEDAVISYILFDIVAISGAIGFEISFNGIILLFAVEALLLAFNDSYIAGREDLGMGAKTIATLLYMLCLVKTTLLYMVNELNAIFDTDDYGKITGLGVVILASVAAELFMKKDLLSRILGTIWTPIFLIAAYIDVTSNLDIIPSYYRAEVSFFLTILFIVFIRVIWSNNEKNKVTVDSITFVLACMEASKLLGHNIIEEELACVLTLGIVSVIAVIIASIINERKYQILSGVVLGLLAIYLTRAFWASIAWWVYLLFAGIICIVVAIIKEKKSRSDEDVVKNFTVKVIDDGLDFEN